MSVNHVLTAIGGSTWGGAIAVTSLGIFCFFQRYAAFFLLPSILMLFFGFFSERFIFFGAVPIGLAVAWVAQQAWERARKQARSDAVGKLGKIDNTFELKEKPSLSAVNLAGAHIMVLLRLFVFRFIAVSFAIILFYSQAHWFFSWLPEGYFVNAHDKVAVALRHEAQPNAPVWAWWDDGYFLRARAGLSPMFDGGSQEPYRAAVVARPFMTADIRFSRRWIRFFALRGMDALNPLHTAWGGQDKAWKLVETIFAADQPETILATLPPVKIASKGVNEWLFPQGRVYIYFSQRILRLSKWWGSIGLYVYPKPEQAKSYIDVFEREDFLYNPSTNFLRLPVLALEKGYTAVSGVYETNRKPLMAPWPKEDGLFAVVSPYSRWLYFANLEGLSSLPLRLMAPAGVELEGFRLISADYDYAGAWEVLP